MNKFLEKIIADELERQNSTLGMIPSESYTSSSVRQAVGSILMHKYSEGYPSARYYEGNDHIDRLEELCREMVLKVMLKHDKSSVKLNWHANVQVISGSMANLAVYNSILKPGDKIMSMYLPDGGHLSHGWSYSVEREKNNSNDFAYLGGDKKVNIVSKFYNVLQYKTDLKTNLFNYGEIEKLALKFKPKLIITGGTSYPRNINYKRMKQIALKAGSYYLSDIAHEAGLVAGGALPSPFEFADFVTFTTHKTLRGPRGAVAMCRKDFAKNLDQSVFPGLQGGPFNHSIAGITQAFFEANTKEFETYSKQVIKNAKVLASELMKKGFDVISEGTDKHLVLIEVLSQGISGSLFSKALAQIGIITNKNTVPNEQGTPFNPSGVRLGTPILTMRGMKESEMRKIAEIIFDTFNICIEHKNLNLQELINLFNSEGKVSLIRKRVKDLTKKHPLK